MLDLSIIYGFEEGAWFFIKKGVNLLNQTKDNDWTIHLAVEHGMISVIEKIVENHSSSINLLDKRNQTPIRMASLEIRTQPEIYLPIFKLLIKNGADPYIKNKFGKNAIDAFNLGKTQLMPLKLSVMKKKFY